MGQFWFQVVDESVDEMLSTERAAACHRQIGLSKTLIALTGLQNEAFFKAVRSEVGKFDPTPRLGSSRQLQEVA